MGELLNYYISQRSIDIAMAEDFKAFDHPLRPDMALRVDLYNREDISGDNYLGKYVTRVYEDFIETNSITRSRAFEYVINTHLIAGIIENYEKWCNLSSAEVNEEIKNYIRSKGGRI